MIAMAMMLAAAVASAVITTPGPQGPLEGAYLDAGRHSPLILIIPGSGPTDRDGNNPLGVSAAQYRLLAEALAARGVSSVRIDKRGMFGSKAAVRDPNAVTIGDYVERRPELGRDAAQAHRAMLASGCSATARARSSRLPPPRSRRGFAA